MICISHTPRSVAEFGQWDAWKGDCSAWVAGREEYASSHSRLGGASGKSNISYMTSASTSALGPWA